MGRRATGAAAFHISLGLIVTACGFSTVPPSGTPETPGPSPTRTLAPAATPAIETRPATILSRITLPYPGPSTPDPWVQTPGREHVVVTADALWVIVNFEYLVRVDLASNQVTAVESLAMPVRPSFGGAGLWLYGPTDSPRSAAPASSASIRRLGRSSASRGASRSTGWQLAGTPSG